MLVTVAGSAAPWFALRCRTCPVPPRRRRWSARAQGQGRDDPQASLVKGGAAGPPNKLPRTALRVGAGVALALALGVGGASWTARGRSAACPVLQPSLLCDLANATGGAPNTLKQYMDDLAEGLRKKGGKESYKYLLDRLDEKFKKSHDFDKGMKVIAVYILMENWKMAKETCQRLAEFHPDDSRVPRLLPAVIDMRQAMQTMMSTEPTTIDDIELTERIYNVPENALVAWKENLNNRKKELAKGSTDSST